MWRFVRSLPAWVWVLLALNIGGLWVIGDLALNIGSRPARSTQDWAAEAQGFYTFASLVVTSVIAWVTGVYAWLTREMARAAREQAGASSQQAEAAARQLAVAEHVLRETVRSRLADATPITDVRFEGATVSPAEGGSFGNVRWVEFERTRVTVTLTFSFVNHGSSTTLLTVFPPGQYPPGLVAETDWTPRAHQRPIGDHRLEQFTLAFTAIGHDVRRWAGNRLELEFDARSPLTGVTDHHTWAGQFDHMPGIVGSDLFDHNAATGVSGASVASIRREWPDGA